MGVGHKRQELGAAWPSVVLLLKRQRWETTYLSSGTGDQPEQHKILSKRLKQQVTKPPKQRSRSTGYRKGVTHGDDLLALGLSSWLKQKLSKR